MHGKMAIQMAQLNGYFRAQFNKPLNLIEEVGCIQLFIFVMQAPVRQPIFLCANF